MEISCRRLVERFTAVPIAQRNIMFVRESDHGWKTEYLYRYTKRSELIFFIVVTRWVDFESVERMTCSSGIVSLTHMPIRTTHGKMACLSPPSERWTSGVPI
jgi:hypothetical protein